MNTEKSEGRYTTVWLLLLLEVAVCGLIIGGYAIASIFIKDIFDYKLFTGAALGTVATVANLFALTFSVNRAIDGFIAARGDKERTEEESEQFANQYGPAVQTAIAKSYVTRTLILVGACGLLFTGWFRVLPVVIPMLMQRPLIMVIEYFRKGDK